MRKTKVADFLPCRVTIRMSREDLAHVGAMAKKQVRTIGAVILLLVRKARNESNEMEEEIQESLRAQEEVGSDRELQEIKAEYDARVKSEQGAS